MVCCTLIAALLGLLLRPLMAARTSPLAWRPNQSVPSRPARAAGRAQSFVHAVAGLEFLARNEPNMRFHLAAAVTVSIAALWLGIDAAGWRWLILAMGLVLAAEALNTGIEQACNAVTHEYRPAIKAAKDAAAAGVLIAAIAAALIGASVFGAALAQGRPGASPPLCSAPS